ncbi:MAG: AGE family epimerase/isomerase [Candidatus Helarchaeota archaeon]
MSKRLYNAILLLNIILLNFLVLCLSISIENPSKLDSLAYIQNKSGNSPYIYSNPPEINYPIGENDTSHLFYYYRNLTWYKANLTWNALSSNTKDVYGGFNSSLANLNKKELLANLEAGNTLIELYKANLSQSYLNASINLTEYIINTFWNGSIKLFISSLNRTGSPISNISFTADNLLSIDLLLKMYDLTKNQTYIDIVNQTIKELNRTLWDHQYKGYYRSNNQSDLLGKKYLYENGLGLLINFKISNNPIFNANIRDLAYSNFITLYKEIDNNLKNGTNGYFSSGYRNWTRNGLSTNKNLRDNSIMLNAFIEFYRLTHNDFYYDKILDVLSFLNNFVDNTKSEPALVYELNWNGSTMINKTILTKLNSEMIIELLDLYEITNNGTYYLTANNYFNFLNTYLWDSNLNMFNYSITFGGNNNTQKYVETNSIAIRALINFRTENFYLTRANTTISLLLHHLTTENAFNFYTTNDWEYSFFFGSFHIQKMKITSHVATGILTLINLAKSTGIQKYIDYAEKNMKYLIANSRVGNGFIVNISDDSEGKTQAYLCEDNAMMIYALISLYEETNNLSYLEIANSTWYFMNSTFWDRKNGGYNYSYGVGSNKSFKTLIANINAIKANLKILQTNNAIFDQIRNNASLLINKTIKLINDNLWDNVNYGYYFNASVSWTPFTDTNKSKQLEMNALMITTLLSYNDQYPNHLNHSLYNLYCKNISRFLLEHFIDQEYGGVFSQGYSNGTIVYNKKDIVSTSEFIIALIAMYKEFKNSSYYENASNLANYVNQFYWDYEYGGYYFEFNRRGLPLEFINMGKYGKYYVKYAKGNLIAINMLLTLNELETNLTNFFIVVENNKKVYDFNEKEITFGIEIYNSNGIKINTAGIMAYVIGKEQTDTNGKELHGIGSVYSFNYSSGKYSTKIDITPFLDLIFVGIGIFNTTTVNYFDYHKINRSLSRYLDIAYKNLNTLPNKLIPVINFWDYSKHGYYYKIMLDNKTAFENLMAIKTLMNFIQSSGLNYGLNWTTFCYDQVFTKYLEGTIGFLNRLSKVNQSLNYEYFPSSITASETHYSSITYSKDNALAIIVFLELYKNYNKSEYLETANRTWNYLNATFWDRNATGFLSSNWSTNISNKNLETQIWAILAYSSILNTPEINEKIKNSSSKIINLTVSNILNNLWDSTNNGFYSEFNGTNWQPINNTKYAKTALSNILAIKMLLERYNLTGNTSYYNKALNTLQFLDQNLFDSKFGGYYTAVNGTNYLSDSDKNVVDNAYLIDDLLDLYNIDKNFTYFEKAEKIAFYLSTFAYSSDFSLFLPRTSRVGSATGMESELHSLPNFILCNSFINLEKIRTSFKRPLVISNITVNKFDISSTQKELTVYLEITDSNMSKVGNVSVLVYLYGVPELFTFKKSSDNLTYYNTFNISMMSKTVNIHILVLNTTYASTYTTYTYERKFPAYVKIAYETLASIFKYLKMTKNGFYNSSFNSIVSTSGNLLILKGINDIINIIGSTILSYNWYGNDTLINAQKLAAEYLENNLMTIPKENISGFLEYNTSGAVENKTFLYDNALAVITFLDIYQSTHDNFYLDLANNTWLYLNNTFWDSTLGCYRSDNTTSNPNISSTDNFLAMLAGLKINQTIELRQTIRNQALKMVNLTYQTINTTFWDKTNGGYYSFGNSTGWSKFWDKDTKSNSLAIIVNLKMHKLFDNSSYYNLSCYRMANTTAQVLQNHLWDDKYGGFYRKTYSNWSFPQIKYNMTKFLEYNSWAVLALMDLFNTSKNKMHYYYIETTLHFLITYMGNHTTSLTTPGFYSFVNRSGYLYTRPIPNIYPGDLVSSSLCIQALIKVFNIVNTTFLGNWLNGSIKISASNCPPIGEYANISFTLKDKFNNTKTGIVNITIIKWHKGEGVTQEIIFNKLKVSFNENTSEYYIGNINISNSENIFIYVSALNDSFGPYYNIFYIKRAKTAIVSVGAYKNDKLLKFLPVFGSSGNNYQKDFAYYAYVLGEDVIDIKGRYVDNTNLLNPQGIPNAHINATIYFTNNGSMWESKIITTDSDGWFEVFFGPVSNQSIFEGIYNITFHASHVNTSITPKTWYSSTDYLVRVSVGYGLFIANYTTKNPIIAQGDIFTINITIKNERLSDAATNITFYGENNFIIEINRSVVVHPGYTSFLQDLKIDERCQVGDYKLYADISYQGRWLHSYFITISIRNAIEIISITVPNKIAQDDQREFVLKAQNFKKHVNAYFSIRMQSIALKDIYKSELLLPNETREFYLTFRPVLSIPKGTYTGTIEIHRQNYTIQYEGADQYQFSIEITSNIGIDNCYFPQSLLQGQSGYISVFLENHRSVESKINVVYYWEGSNDITSVNYTLKEYFEKEYIYIQFSYNGLPWDFGDHNLILKIYYIDENNTNQLLYETKEPIKIELSVFGIFIDYILPFMILFITIFFIFLFIFRKKEEKKKLKK